jgi:tRNA pseudouridine32 synthase/23S rRNA pseudouridine746 synthase
MARLAQGAVSDGEGAPVTADLRCRPGLRLRYYREVTAEPTVPDDVTLIFRDERLLVACKPHGLPVTPGGRFVNACLLARIRALPDATDAVPLHRLDRDTAGLVMFSLDPSTRGRYQRLFATGRVAKLYEAVCAAPAGDWTGERVVESRIEPDALWFRSRETAGPVNARTRVRLLERRGALARFALEPLTGKRHQLRLHMAGLGAPILNDALYPQVLTQPGDTAPRPPLQLLARRLAFHDPLDGRPREFTSSRRLDMA